MKLPRRVGSTHGRQGMVEYADMQIRSDAQLSRPAWLLLGALAAAGAIAALVTECTIEVQRDEDLPQGVGS